MTIVNADLMDVAKFRGDGWIRVRAKLAGPANSDQAFKTAAWHPFTVRDGLATLTDLDPGPAQVRAQMGGWSETWDVTVPDEAEPISFTTLLDAYTEYEPAVVGQAQQARDEAIAAAGQASSSATAAASSATAAQSAYDQLTDDIENAAGRVRDQVHDDADRAESAAAGAEDSESASATSAASALASKNAASTSETNAGTSAGSAAASATAADGSKTAAANSATTASNAAATATSKATEATGAASTATSARDEAQTARFQAESARDDAQYAQHTAEDAATTATAKAAAADGAKTAAATSASSAVASASAAQSAVDSFGLSAGTVTTGGAGSSAQVTITKSGTQYVANFTIPRGNQGLQGVKGDGLKLDYTPATYAELPTGLNSTTDVGKTAFVTSTNRLYVWSGTAWPAENAGLTLTGAKGDPGLSAYQVAVVNGFSGTESEWLDSLDGDDGGPGASAYQVAVANGFTGSESQWLDSLHGADGATSYTELTNVPATFPPIIGTIASTAKAGNWMPEWSDVKSKPSTYPPSAHTHGTSGIVDGAITVPKTASDVQSSLTKADTAVQPAALTVATATKVSGSVNGTATGLTLWTGTAAQYAAIGSKSATTVYVVTE